MLEATCGKCGETFVPADEDDTEHVQRDDGTECGGEGTITGEWVYNASDPINRADRAVVDDTPADECKACDAWYYGDGLMCEVHNEEARR